MPKFFKPGRPRRSLAEFSGARMANGDGNIRSCVYHGYQPVPIARFGPCGGLALAGARNYSKFRQAASGIENLLIQLPCALFGASNGNELARSRGFGTGSI